MPGMEATQGENASRNFFGDGVGEEDADGSEVLYGENEYDESADTMDLNRQFLAKMGIGIEIGENAMLLPTLTEFISLKKWDREA